MEKDAETIYVVYRYFIRAHYKRHLIHRPVFCAVPFTETDGRRIGCSAAITDRDFPVSHSARQACGPYISGFRSAVDLARVLAMVHFLDHHDAGGHVRLCVFPGPGIQADAAEI